jgi:hypothetical protein
MATTNITYNNPNKRNGNRIDNSNRLAINKDVLRMMAQNPTLGIGYLIGSAIGENYFGKKRANSTQEAVDSALNEYNKNLPGNASGEMDWDAANKLLDAYAGQNNTAGNMVNGMGIQDAMASKSGWTVPPSQNAVAPVPAEAPAAPLTPQQANAPAITMDNAGVLGGATTMQDAWEQLKNSGTFNNGNTGYFTNGIRNLDNVVTTGTQAPAPAPAAPAQAGVNYVGTEPFIDKQAQIYMQAGASPEQARGLAARAGERIKRMYSDPRFLAQLNETQKKNWFGK